MGSILATRKEENNLPRDLRAEPGEEGQFFPYEVVHSEAAMAAHRETPIFRPKSRQSHQSRPQQTTSRLNLSRPAARPQTPDPALAAEYSGPASPPQAKHSPRPEALFNPPTRAIVGDRQCRLQPSSAPSGWKTPRSSSGPLPKLCQDAASLKKSMRAA